VEEARALLDGTARITTYALASHPPAWVCVNQLVHADVTVLAHLAETGWTVHRSNWDNACAILAEEFLGRVKSTGRLADVQRAVLPVELDLLNGQHPQPMTPATLVSWVTDTLTSSGFTR
jgi:hypothetical protein